MACRCQLYSQQCPGRTQYIVCTDTTTIGPEASAYSGNVWRSDDCGGGLFAISGNSYVLFSDYKKSILMVNRGRKLRD